MKRNREAFEEVWEVVAAPQLELLKEELSFIEVSSSAKEDIWKAYKAFNRHCSENYMVDSFGLLDRHKVSACLLLAIVSVSPISIPQKRIKETVDLGAKKLLTTINEHFAITVAASDLVSYIIERHIARNSNSQNADSFEDAFYQEVEGIPFYMFSVNHGESYLENLATALYYTKCENNYNVLLLANTIYHWDLRTCEIAGLPFG